MTDTEIKKLAKEYYKSDLHDLCHNLRKKISSFNKVDLVTFILANSNLFVSKTSKQLTSVAHPSGVGWLSTPYGQKVSEQESKRREEVTEWAFKKSRPKEYLKQKRKQLR
jgi:hypothetical protein